MWLKVISKRCITGSIISKFNNIIVLQEKNKRFGNTYQITKDNIKLLTTDAGRIAMSAATVNDVAAWILLALAITLSGSNSSPLVSYESYFVLLLLSS